MTDHWLHHRLIRKRVDVELNQFWLYHAIKRAMDKARGDVEFGKVSLERIIISDKGIGLPLMIEPKSKWQRFVDAWVGK